MVEFQGKTYNACKVNHRRSIWEDAKLQAYEFRAVGNEPGWVLTIKNRDELKFVHLYGQETYQFPSSQRVINKAIQSTEYSARADGNSLHVTLDGKQCSDTMVEETYPVTVQVTINGETFRGCGRALF